MNKNKYYKEVIDNILYGLSLSGTEQLGFYEDFVPTSDELALTYEYAASYAIYLLTDGLITQKTYERIMELDELFCKFNDIVGIWDDSELLTNEKWEEVRKKAKIIISSIDNFKVEKFNPNLG